MPDLADLIVLAFALGLGVPGAMLVAREVLGDRLRRERVPRLRCPGRWERVLLVLPWRGACWYDMTATPIGADGRRRCPECGRSSPDHRLRGSRRSGANLLGGLLLMGVSAISLKGHSIYLGGIAAAPSWVLALVPFDEQAWVERQPLNTGDPWRDVVGEELRRRNELALLRGPGAAIMLERVRRALVDAGAWHDHAALAPVHATLNETQFRGEIDRLPLRDAAEHLAQSIGVRIDVPHVLFSPGTSVLGLSPGLVTSALQPVVPPWKSLPDAVTSLPDWPMTGAQALDILAWRAGQTGVCWRATPQGVVLDAVLWNPSTGAYDAWPLAGFIPDTDAAVERGIADQSLLPSTPRQGLIPGRPPVRPGLNLAESNWARRILAARGWLFRAPGPDLPAAPRGFGGPGQGGPSWLFQPYPGPVRGIGSTLLLPALPHEHRQVRQLWDVLERQTPDPPPPRRDDLLAALALIDQPGPEGDVSAPESLALEAIAAARGLRMVVDPLLRGGVNQPSLAVHLARAMRGWTLHPDVAVIVAPDRVLLTDPVTQTLLAVPRLYRLRAPAERVVDRDGVDLARVHLPTLAQRLKRLAGDFPTSWAAAVSEREHLFVARTTEDEHAMLTWLLEQAETTLRTGRPSVPSAPVGHPVAVYDLSALFADRPPGANDDLHQAVPPPLEELMGVRPGINALRTQGLRDVPWFRRAGPIVIVRLSPEDHARLREALEVLGVDSAEGDDPPGP